jgi:TolB-like protein
LSLALDLKVLPFDDVQVINQAGVLSEIISEFVLFLSKSFNVIKEFNVIAFIQFESSIAEI